MQKTIEILGQSYALECADCDERRLEDLARALEERLAGYSGDGVRRLVLAALSLIDEAQATGAALERARHEIERLTDLIVDAKLDAQNSNAGLDSERGRVGALRVAQGSA
jgi:cell division protein ZapA (FtsZ GTPase activity inhibitor)